MKNSLSILMALGMVSQFAFAQVPTQPQDEGKTTASDVTGPSSSTLPPGAPADSSSGASGAASADSGTAMQESESPIARLKPVTQDNVTYLCGGVGDEEASYMKKEARGYDLMLTFASRDGSYLADVDVDIKDAKGNTVLQTACDSPILLVDLPRSGTYRIRAETAGYELNRTVRINAQKKRKSVASSVMSWPQAAAEVRSDSGTASGSSGVIERDPGESTTDSGSGSR